MKSIIIITLFYFNLLVAHTNLYMYAGYSNPNPEIQYNEYNEYNDSVEKLNFNSYSEAVIGFVIQKEFSNIIKFKKNKNGANLLFTYKTGLGLTEHQKFTSDIFTSIRVPFSKKNHFMEYGIGFSFNETKVFKTKSGNRRRYEIKGNRFTVSYNYKYEIRDNFSPILKICCSYINGQSRSGKGSSFDLAFSILFDIGPSASIIK